MAGKSTSFENSVIALIFNRTAISGIADDAASPLTSFWLSLHSSDPTDDGNQTSNETAYTSYLRQSVSRATGGFTVSGSSARLYANVAFPEATGGTDTITHFGVGTASSGAGVLLYSGVVSPNIAVSSGVTPVLTTDTTILEG